jgi:hypothetical protein
MDQHDTQDLAELRQTVHQNFNKQADTLMDRVDAENLDKTVNLLDSIPDKIKLIERQDPDLSGNL